MNGIYFVLFQAQDFDTGSMADRTNGNRRELSTRDPKDYVERNSI